MSQWVALTSVILLLNGCARGIGIGREAESELFEPDPVKVEHGTASFYAGRFIGDKTASGEIYRRDDVTAAHRTLPFGTIVRVTNKENGKSVLVRVNNRGPHIEGRIVDLSLRPAKALEMRGDGTVPVKVGVLEPKAETSRIRDYVDHGQFKDTPEGT